MVVLNWNIQVSLSVTISSTEQYTQQTHTHAVTWPTYINNISYRRQQFPWQKFLTHDDDQIGRNMESWTSKYLKLINFIQHAQNNKQQYKGRVISLQSKEHTWPLGNYTITHRHPRRCGNKTKQGDLKPCPLDEWTAPPCKILKL